MPVYEAPRTKVKTILKNLAFIEHLKDFCAEVNRKIFEIHEEDLRQEMQREQEAEVQAAGGHARND